MGLLSPHLPDSPCCSINSLHPEWNSTSRSEVVKFKLILGFLLWVNTTHWSFKRQVLVTNANTKLTKKTNKKGKKKKNHSPTNTAAGILNYSFTFKLCPSTIQSKLSFLVRLHKSWNMNHVSHFEPLQSTKHKRPQLMHRIWLLTKWFLGLNRIILQMRA